MSDLSPREKIVYHTLAQATLGDLEDAARDVVTALHLNGHLVADGLVVSKTDLIDIEWCLKHEAPTPLGGGENCLLAIHSLSFKLGECRIVEAGLYIPGDEK